MYDLERNLRLLVINIIKNQNEELIKQIAKSFKLNEEELMNKYLVSYYYMPIIERELKKLTI